MEYFIVTPVKNESSHLNDLYKSICEQTNLPVLWMIVDDGSTDNSLELIKSFSAKSSFVEYISLPSDHKRNILQVYAVIKQGIDEALKIISERNLNWNYFSVLDGDMVLPINYYEFLINKISKDDKVLIARGHIWSYNGKRYKPNIVTSKNNPGNSARVITRQCFEEFGFPTCSAADTVLNIKVKNKGYETIEYDDIIAYQKRLSNNAEGYWKGMKVKAHEKYYLGFSPSYAVFYFVLQLFKFPFLHSFAFIYVYLIDVVSKKEKTSDSEIINYSKSKVTYHFYRTISAIKDHLIRIKLH